MWELLWLENKEDKNEETQVSKVIIVGNSFVGKSSLLFKFTDKTFEDSFISTLGVDIRTHTFTFSDEEKIKIQFYDTAGQERFISLTTSYYRDAAGVILVYDVSSLESFQCITNWVNDVDRCCTASGKQIVKLLVGNKCDLQERKVSEEMGRKLADKINAKFLETSAKKNINVADVFNTMAKDLLELAVPKEEEEKPQVILVGPTDLSSCQPTSWWCW